MKEETKVSKARDGPCSQELKIVHTGLNTSEQQAGRYFLERLISVCQTLMSIVDKTNASPSSSGRGVMIMGRG